MPGLTGDVILLSFDATAASTPGSVTFSFENEKMSDSLVQGFDIISAGYNVSIGETATPESTPKPTDEPTSEPTEEPTSELTPEPTDEPTPEPTPEPTDEPITADVSGQTIVAGRANNDWSGTTVTIDGNGQIGTTDATGNFSITDVATGPLDSITTDASGYLSAVCTGVPGLQWLRQKQSCPLSVSSVVTLMTMIWWI